MTNKKPRKETSKSEQPKTLPKVKPLSSKQPQPDSPQGISHPQSKLSPLQFSGSSKEKSSTSPKSDRIHQLIRKALPTIAEIFEEFKNGDMSGFEIQIPNHKGRLVYVGELLRSPNHQLLAQQVKKLLDSYYPDKMNFVMASAHSKNTAVAEAVSTLLSDMRMRDRADIESQLVAMMAAFHMGR